MKKNRKCSSKKQPNKKKQYAKKGKRIVEEKSAVSKKLRGKKRSKRVRENRRKQLVMELGLSILGAGIVLWLLSLFLFSFVKTEGYGMLNTFRDGDIVFVNKKSKIKRFDLVYFKVPETNEVSIRRVIGLPYEQVFYENDQLFVDGHEKTEYFLQEALVKAHRQDTLLTEDFSMYEIKGTDVGFIAEGKYLVLGDNRQFSSDSRAYGLIDGKDIIGVVKMTLLPFHRMTMF